MTHIFIMKSFYNRISLNLIFFIIFANCHQHISENIWICGFVKKPINTSKYFPIDTFLSASMLETWFSTTQTKMKIKKQKLKRTSNYGECWYINQIISLNCLVNGLDNISKENDSLPQTQILLCTSYNKKTNQSSAVDDRNHKTIWYKPFTNTNAGVFYINWFDSLSPILHLLSMYIV